MNKSRVARDLYRKVFNDNLIDIKDSDARKQIVRETGNFRPLDKSNKTKVESLQRQLQEVYGPDVIDFYKNGVLQTGEDAVDGKFLKSCL